MPAVVRDGLISKPRPRRHSTMSIIRIRFESQSESSKHTMIPHLGRSPIAVTKKSSMLTAHLFRAPMQYLNEEAETTLAMKWQKKEGQSIEFQESKGA